MPFNTKKQGRTFQKAQLPTCEGPVLPAVVCLSRRIGPLLQRCCCKLKTNLDSSRAGGRGLLFAVQVEEYALASACNTGNT